jgi:hypothetical protein
MTSAVLAPSLQASVERFGPALKVPSGLLALHPRRPGNPGNAAALAPAITLGVLSAFEGFAEDFMATALYRQGQSFAEIAKKLNLSNPDVADIEALVGREFPTVARQIGAGFNVTVWSQPVLRKKILWFQADLNWDAARCQARGWMQVRHCLAHGLTNGWGTEYGLARCARTCRQRPLSCFRQSRARGIRSSFTVQSHVPASIAPPPNISRTQWPSTWRRIQIGPPFPTFHWSRRRLVACKQPVPRHGLRNAFARLVRPPLEPRA